MPPKAEAAKSEAEILREELSALRGEMSSVKGELNAARAEKQQAELATMSEGERRLVAEEAAADNAITAAESEATALEGQLAGLWSEGKFAEAASIQRKIAAAENRLQNEKGRKDWLANQRETLKGQRTTHAQRPVETTNASNLDPSLQAWIDAHPRFKSWANKEGNVEFADKRYHDAAMAGHYAALARGVAPNSREYFEVVEEHTGDRQITQEESPYSGAGLGGQGGLGGGDNLYTVEKPQAGAAGSRTAAPPSRGAPGATRPGRAPDLTADEREAADGIMGHIADPAERYTRYAAARDSRRNRGATH